MLRPKDYQRISPELKDHRYILLTFFLFFCCAKSCEHGKACSLTVGEALGFLTEVLVFNISCLATLTPEVGGVGGRIPRYSILSSDPESSSPSITN